jgi:Arc/MetJ-type ribon-helix-helix transcriptional regulator
MNVTPIRRRYTFWINEAEADGLKHVKEEEGTSESEQIRQAIRTWLRKKGVKTGRKRAVTRKRP